MVTRILLIAAAMISLSWLIAPVASDASAAGAPGEAARVAGPIAYGNLAVYVVRGRNLLAGQHYLTLKQGMELHKVIAHDGNTTVENQSDHALFIQSGEIVRGGIQDRTISDDMVVSAHGSASLYLHCVEHDRSGQRRSENPSEFNSSNNALSSRALRLANYQKNQEAVWDEVGTARRQLAVSLGDKTVAGNNSSSLELAFDDPRVIAATREYEAAIGKGVAAVPDAVGFFFAVNGQLCSGDVYGSPELFAQMFPKLLHAAALEALSKRYRLKEGSIPDAPEATTVLAMLDQADAAKSSPADTGQSGDRARMTQRQTKEMLVFESTDTQVRSAFLHRAYLTR